MTEPAATLACPSCAAALQPDERFCSSCGAPQAGAPIEPGHAAESPWAQIVADLQAHTLGEFEIAHELGRGGMAAVYLAHEIALNRLVAIKVMAPGLFLGPGMVERFRQEAVTVANLSHPNLITIHAVRQSNDLHFLVMKYVEGRSLEAVLSSGEGRLPFPVVRAILFQVGSALAYAHRRGVIHRDIKPGNVLLDADGNAIVTDFGIAKVGEMKGQTQTGTMVGTPAYMSPEQCYGGDLTWSSDLYSLGIVAYELLTGVVPFAGTTFNVLQAHTTTPPPPLTARRPDCPPDLEAAVLRMLAKDPADRFASMADALAALGAAPLGEADPLRDALARLALPDPAAARRLAIRPALSPLPQNGSRVGWLAIAGAPDVIVAGDRFTLTAVARTGAGAEVAGRSVSWSSSDYEIASVTASGEVTARAPGRVNVTAVCEGVLASLPLTVLTASGQTLTLPKQPPPRSRTAGSRVPLAAAAVVALAAAGGALVWSGRDREAPPSAIPAGAGPGGAIDSAAPPAPLASAPGADSNRPAADSTFAPADPPPAKGAGAGSPSRPARPVSRPVPSDTAATSAPPAVARDTPVAAPTPVVTSPPPAPAPVAVRPPDYTPQIREALAGYVQAINARSLPAMREIYPGLSSELASEWRGLFSSDVRELKVVATQTDITPSGDLADARFVLLLSFTPRGGEKQSRAIACRVTLRRGPDGTWRFATLDQRATTAP